MFKTSLGHVFDPGPWRGSPPRKSFRDSVTIAGSGPSSQGYEGHVDISTKKFPVQADYWCAQHPSWLTRRSKEALQASPMLYECREHRPDIWVANTDFWNGYWQAFMPTHHKPSLGTMTVFCAYERWAPKEIRLIGFDWVLDEYPRWTHDAVAEKKAISQLTNIIDLRYS